VWKQPLRGVLLLLCVLEYSGHGRALFTYCESVFILAMD